jgi:hypothetical protein
MRDGDRLNLTGSAFLARFFAHTRHLVELRALPSKARCFTRKRKEIEQFIEERAGENLYFGCATRGGGGGKKQDCRELVALWIDIDYKTTPDLQASELLAAFPLEPSIVVESGGGLHLYWLLDAPTDAHKGEVEPILRGLAATLKADPAAAEIARIMRMPGTRNQKYEPPRECGVREAHWDRRYTLRDFEQFRERHVPAPTQKSVGNVIADGQRNATLTSIAGKLRHDGLSETELLASLLAINQQRCITPLPDGEIAAIAKSVARYSPGKVTAPVDGTTLGILASMVTVQRVSWVWPGRIPLGKVTVLDGDPGFGKSTIALDIAARVSTGSPMPDGAPGIDGGVLILNAEDGPADTIVPRLKAAGANLERTKILQTVPSGSGERQPDIPADIAAIEAAAVSVGAKLIIVDPLMAFLAPQTTNAYKDQDVRRALSPLAAMAERIGSAVLVVRHLNKSADASPIYRGGGSIGIIGAARSGLLVARDPDDETGVSRVLAATKVNLGPLPRSLRYSLEPHGESIRVQWAGESEHFAASLLAEAASVEGRTTQDEAVDFLRSFLEGGEAPAEEAWRRARAAGFADRTLDRAKSRLGIKARRKGYGRDGKWIWALPDASKDATPTNEAMASFDDEIHSTSLNPVRSPKDATSAEPGGLWGVSALIESPERRQKGRDGERPDDEVSV